MRQPTEEIGWIVAILLSVAAIVANTLDGTTLGVILLIILVAICAVFASQHEGRGESS